MSLKIYFADYIDLELPKDHRFPASKYRLTREKLKDELGLPESTFVKSPLISYEQLLSTHSQSYVDSIYQGKLDRMQQRKIGFPWSESLLARTRASTGGTLAAAYDALKVGYGAQLAGGTHHAHLDFGAGFCVFNDFAVTSNILIQEKLVNRIAIVDLDVHHGDGNASLLTANPRVFVFSMHGEKNYPLKKPPSDLDVALPDDCSDDDYLRKLQESMTTVLQFEPELILYQAGVDALKDDRLGRLQLSASTLFRRDELVFSYAKEFEIPIVHVLGGGYSRPIEPTIEAYVNTFKAARSVFSELFEIKS